MLTSLLEESWARLRQTGSVQEYVGEFQELRLIIGNVSEARVLNRFVRELQLDVKGHVSLQRPEKANRAMELALYYEDGRGTVRVPKQVWQQSECRVPKPMELGVADMQRGGDSKKKDKRPKYVGKCFACDDPKHMVKDCPWWKYKI